MVPQHQNYPIQLLSMAHKFFCDWHRCLSPAVSSLHSALFTSLLLRESMHWLLCSLCPSGILPWRSFHITFSKVIPIHSIFSTFPIPFSMASLSFLFSFFLVFRFWTKCHVFKDTSLISHLPQLQLKPSSVSWSNPHPWLNCSSHLGLSP